MWWVPAGHIPSVEEADERLDYLRANGPTAHAFGFKQRIPRRTDLCLRPPVDSSEVRPSGNLAYLRAPTT